MYQGLSLGAESGAGYESGSLTNDYASGLGDHDEYHGGGLSNGYGGAKGDINHEKKNVEASAFDELVEESSKPKYENAKSADNSGLPFANSKMFVNEELMHGRPMQNATQDGEGNAPKTAEKQGQSIEEMITEAINNARTS